MRVKSFHSAYLCVLYASAVYMFASSFAAESQRTQRYAEHYS